MSVQIDIADRFELSIKEDGALSLPTIILAPVENRQPYIHGVKVQIPSVEGVSKTLAERIQNAYESHQYIQPVKLQGKRPVGMSPVLLSQGLAGKVDCKLNVSVEYSETNRPGSILQSTSATCRLFYPGAPLESVSQPAPIKPAQPKFAGWLAVDLGTASSTVTLYDSNRLSPKQSLPPEQEKCLREGFDNWLETRPAEALPDASEGDWRNFIGRVAGSLAKTDKNADALAAVDGLLNIFRNGASTDWHAAICQIELQLRLSPEPFRKAASQKLYEIYHDAFREPRLESQNLFPVELDLDEGTPDILSEVEIVDLDPLRVRMGKQVNKKRLDAISKANDQTWKEIQQRFHRSPKRYLLETAPQTQAQTTTIALDGKQREISHDEELQAAWAHLIDLTDKYRQKFDMQFTPRRFTHAVVTYPTVAPPAVRHKIKQLFTQVLGGAEDITIQTDYDEATSAAIFYLMCELGGTQELGIEAFKCRCRRYGVNTWLQDVLVLDIGGGTTDIALIRLTIKDDDPFEPGEDRGLGGRYYEITPELRGASGHLQLGGQLITLKLFRLLKVALADHLLTGATEGRLQNETLTRLMSELPEDFYANGQFLGGSLLACINKDEKHYKKALDAAERVIPTRWKEDPSRLQAFETIWEWADKIKIELGSSRRGKNHFSVSWEKLRPLLVGADITLTDEEFKALNFSITREQFEQVTRPSIEEAIDIAQGLLKSRMQNEGQGSEKADWLILSGQTCNLYLVKEVIREKFINSDHFEWNPENVTFVSSYAKLATSIGACYAEKLQQLVFEKRGAIGRLRKGLNEILLNVKNLLFYLPCDFLLETQSGASELLFGANSTLKQLDSEPIGKIRTEKWGWLNLFNAVKRQDYKNGSLRPWGVFRGAELINQLSMSENEWRDKIRGRFEINHRLEISLLLRRGDVDHYQIDDSGYSLNVKSILAPDRRGAYPGAGMPGSGAAAPPSAEIGAESDAPPWDVIVNAGIGNPDADDDPVFKQGEPFTKVFHYPDGRERQGLIKPLPSAPKNGYVFYGRYPQGDRQRLNEEGWRRHQAQFSQDQDYYATLDQDGVLRLHAGEVPYWTSLDKQALLRQEGCVFRVELEPQGQEYDKARDPFCGEH